MNKTILCGRITKELELKQTKSGKSYLINTIAVNRDFKNENGEYETDFIDILIFGASAEFFYRNVSKGDKVLLEGRWQVRKYIDKNNNNREANELVVENIELVEFKKKEELNSYNDVSKNINEDDFMPF